MNYRKKRYGNESIVLYFYYYIMAKKKESKSLVFSLNIDEPTLDLIISKIGKTPVELLEVAQCFKLKEELLNIKNKIKKEMKEKK